MNSPKICGGAIECEGFALLADEGRSSTVLIQSLSTADIATMLAGSGAMMAAGQVAKAIRNAESANARPTAFSDLLKQISHP